MRLIIFLLPIALFGQSIRVCIVETSEKVQLVLENTAILYAEEGRYQLTPNHNPFYVYKKGDLIYLEGNGRFFKFRNTKDFYIKPRRPSTHIRIGKDHTENGKLEFHIGNNALQIITETDIDRYISYVAPNEIYTHDTDYFEAVKAQIVAARTYSLNRVGQYTTFDVYSDTRDQVYKSSIEIPLLVEKAVKATTKQVLLYNNKLIDTKYSASVGGVSESLNYGENNTPNFMVLESGKLIGKIYPDYEWERTFSKNELLDRYNKWFTQNAVRTDTIDRVLKVSILQRKSSGRVDSIKLSINESEVVLSKLDIRKFFHTDGKILPSNLFALSFSTDVLTIKGYGNGHGEGMGQWEAMELSKNDFSYEQILAFFYPESVLGEMN